MLLKGHLRQGRPAGRKRSGRGVEVQPEKDAPAKVPEHRQQAVLAQPRPLPQEALEIHSLHDLPRRQPGQGPPARRQPRRILGRGREEPFHKARLEVAPGHHRKEPALLEVRFRINSAVSRFEAARPQPLPGRTPQPEGGLLAQLALEGVVQSVGPDAKIACVHRHKIKADARRQTQAPIILRHAGDHVLAGELPPARHDTVLDPEGVILLSPQAGLETRVLRHLVRPVPRSRGAHLALVQHQGLQGRHRFDHLPARAEVMKLRLRQRHDGAAQRADGRVLGSGEAPKAKPNSA